MSIILKMDLELLARLDLSPDEYVFLIKQSIDIGPTSTNIDGEKLQALGFIKITDDGIVPRKKAIDLVPKELLDSISVESWIDEWRALWPIGVKTNDRPVRGDKAGCLIKMKKFTAKNNYTKEEIIEATKEFIIGKSKTQYTMMTCADYFIEKDRISLLGALLENNEDRDSIQQHSEDSGYFKEV